MNPVIPIALTLSLIVHAHVAAQKSEPPKVAPTKAAPREACLEWKSKAGQPYWYRLPKKISAKRPPALIFMFHGTGGRHYWSFANYPITSGRFRGDDIVVSPEGVTPGANGTFNFVQNKADGAQIVDLIKTFRAAFPIGKVYLYGHSQGAFFCYWFAGEHPELVDGFVAHAGNVLQVKHTELAKEKLAVGILHARSDPVVSVECATRSAKIYRDAGYQKVKLWIVENIREQAGHWPLPPHVTEMFEWLDLVSADDPALTLAGAERELAKTTPDLAIVAEAVARTAKSLKQNKALVPRHKILVDFLDRLAVAHAQRIAADRKTEKDRGQQPWMLHYRAANASLGGIDAWRKATRSIAGKAKAQTKSAGKAFSRLQKKWNYKSATAAVKAALKTPLAADSKELIAAAQRFAKNGKMKPKEATALETLLADAKQAFEPAEKAGAERATELNASAIESLRTAHPDRFAPAAGAKKP